MKRIGILSDTHAFLHPRVFTFFDACDEVWHAGDIGSRGLADQLSAFKPLRAVYGNIDGQDLRIRCPETLVFQCEQFRVGMMHIGGRPGNYTPGAMTLIRRERPSLFVCGHSHILLVKYDQKHRLLYINPGAAGKYGFHQKITLVRLELDGAEMKNMEVLELDKSPRTGGTD